MTIRIPLSVVSVAVVSAALGAGVTVGAIAWEPWDGDGDSESAALEVSPTPTSMPTPRPKATPTPYQRKLTGAEAEVIVQTTVNTQNFNLVQTPTAEPSEFLILLGECEAVDFNETVKAWILECEATLTSLESGNDTPLSTQTYRLFDATRKVERVGP